jgi:hypothetical protein
MKKAVAVFVLAVAVSGFAQEKADKSKAVDLTADQLKQIDSILAEYDKAGSDLEMARAKFEAAAARRENAQLKYALTVTNLKKELKLGDDYTFDDQAKNFRPVPTPTKKEEK